MCYVNTLPKRVAFLRAVTSLHRQPAMEAYHPPYGFYWKHSEGVDRGKLMQLPTGRYRTPLSRASLAENVSRLDEKFGNLSGEAPRNVRDPMDFRIGSIR